MIDLQPFIHRIKILLFMDIFFFCCKITYLLLYKYVHIYKEYISVIKKLVHQKDLQDHLLDYLYNT